MAGDVDEREAAAARLEAEMAEVCGVLNAATARLVGLVAEVLATGAWQGWGIRSFEHWVTWKCGVSARRARTLVAMARRMAELPETGGAFAAGELAEDQVAVIVRHVPAGTDAEVATLARSATVTQLRRVLGSYVFAQPVRPHTEEGADPDAPEARRVSFGYDDEGSWRLFALLPPDEGALWERALEAARDEVFRHQGGTDEAANARDVTWADAFVAVAEGSLSVSAGLRPHRDRHLVLLHLGTDSEGRVGAQLHDGPVLAEGLRRYVACDARVRGILEAGGRAVSVGRAFRIVPERTRVAVEARDRAVGSRAAPAAGGCRSTTSPTGRTAAPPTRPTSSPCPGVTIASITGASSASAATPMMPTDSSSPTPGVGVSPAAAAPPRRGCSWAPPPSGSGCIPPPTSIPPASASTPAGCTSTRP